MGHVERAIEISVPAEKLFDVLVDLDRLPEWATIVVRTDGAPQRLLRPGDTFRQTIRVAGQELDTVASARAEEASARAVRSNRTRREPPPNETDGGRDSEG